MTIHMKSKAVFVTTFAMLVSTACDAVEDDSEAYDELAEVEDPEELSDMPLAIQLEEDDAERAEAWDGLLPEEIAMLEMEDGTDLEDAPAAENGAGSFTAPPESAAAPSCLKLATWKSGAWSNARVTNLCGNTQRIRVIWAYAFDTACHVVPAGYTYTSGRHRQAFVTEIRSC